MLTQWEIWACAAEVQREHGEAAPVFVAARIGALVLEGDVEGIATWKAIAARLQQLRRQPERLS
jgi:hypothetical protein